MPDFNKWPNWTPNPSSITENLLELEGQGKSLEEALGIVLSALIAGAQWNVVRELQNRFPDGVLTPESPS